MAEFEVHDCCFGEAEEVEEIMGKMSELLDE